MKKIGLLILGLILLVALSYAFTSPEDRSAASESSGSTGDWLR